MEQMRRNLGIPVGLAPDEEGVYMQAKLKELDLRLEEAIEEHRRLVEALKNDPLAEQHRDKDIPTLL
jgi:hypothetical protein